MFVVCVGLAPGPELLGWRVFLFVLEPQMGLEEGAWREREERTFESVAERGAQGGHGG